MNLRGNLKRHIENKRNQKLGKLALSLIIILTFVVGGTLMFLTTQSQSVVNTFTASKVASEIEEVFENNIKTEIKVKNTGNIPAYIRVKLVTYRVDGDKPIAGEATIPEFELGDNWLKAKDQDHVYYYKIPVPGDRETENLIKNVSEIALKEYTDAYGGKQVIEVLAEAIQADGQDGKGNKPVTLAWNVKVDGDANLYLD